MNILAVIPARGWSKGIKYKNLQEIAGKPLIARTIEASRCSKLVARTVVSTDDPKIADVARQYGADVPFMRPSEYATDTAKSISQLIGCSEKTVLRIMSDQQIKDIIKENNNEIRKEKKIADVIECLDILSDNGNKVKINALKEITSVRDYELIKEAYLRYENHF